VGPRAVLDAVVSNNIKIIALNIRQFYVTCTNHEVFSYVIP